MINTTTASKVLPVALVATVEVATRMEITSVAVGVTLAALGGGLSQMRRAEGSELTIGQTIAEWGLSGLAGLFAHTATMQATADPWMIWTACVAAGLAGSSGLAKYLDASKNDQNG